MKIVYLFNSRIPTEKAHGLQIMQMCAVFASQGHDVTLLVPDRNNHLQEDAFMYYGVERNFRILKAPVFDAIRFSRWLGPLSMWLLEMSFARSARKAIKELSPDVIYSRDTYSNLWTSDATLRVTELHTLPRRFRKLYARIWKRSDRVVAMTEGLRDDLVALGIPDDRIVVAHDAVDLERFDAEMTKKDVREALGLPLHRTIAVYIGRFYAEQGIETLVEASKKLESDTLVVMVGGIHSEGDGPNRKIVGHVSPMDILKWLRAADFALMPYTGTSEHVSRYASPMKLFEYLGAGLPIISSNLPSVREVLTESEALFVPPDDTDALARAIDALARDAGLVKRMSSASRSLAKGKTWKARARTVLSHLTRREDARERCFKWWPEIAVIALALSVRLLYVLVFPQQSLVGGDSLLYLGYADWMRGTIPWDNAWNPTFQAGYPAFLALIRTVFGESLVVIRATQAVIGSVTVGLVMWMGNRWASRRTGLVAGLLLALHIPSVLETGILLTEGLYTLLLTLLVAAVVLVLEKKTWMPAVVAGVVAVSVGATREIGYYASLLLMPLMAWKRAWMPAVVLVASVALAIWATGIIFDASASMKREVSVTPFIAKGYEQTLLRDNVFRNNVLDSSRLIMWPEGALRFLLVPYRMTDLSGGISLKSVATNRDVSLLSKVWSEALAKTMVWVFHLFLTGFALFGLASIRFDRNLKTVILVLGVFFAGTIILASVGRPAGFEVYAPLARYRFPLMPLIILLAASGLDRSRGLEETEDKEIRSLSQEL